MARNSINSEINVYEDEEHDDANAPLIEPRSGGFQEAPRDSQEFPKKRHILGFLGFLGFANVYAMRVNLSVSIVAMVNSSAILNNTNYNLSDSCPSISSNSSTPVKNGEFDWDEQTQGIILGSFFYGYVLTQVPGGRLAETLGGKRIFGIGILITSILTFLTPPAAHLSVPALVVVRILTGVGEGVTFPSMHSMLSAWVPPLERSTFAAIVYAGANFGTIVSLPLSGWLCSLTFMGGWPLSFYIFGFLGIVWFFFWMYFISDTPALHPRISLDEKRYIQNTLKTKNDELASDRAVKLPWCSLLTSVPLIGLLITQCGQAFLFYTQLTELPTYMSNVLHYDIQSNSVLSALPYLTSWIFGISCSIFADYLLQKGYISQKNSYKMWNSVASIVPSIGLIGIAWAGCDKVWIIVLLAVFGAFQGAVYPGNQMNHISLAPQFAGTLYGITNAAGNTCGFLAPYVIGMIIKGNETLSQWKLVFYLAAIINISGNFVYMMFASADEQPWSRKKLRE